MEESTELVRTVEKTKRISMVGETSCYYLTAIYCRERFRKGDFGEIAHGEGEYYHDFDHGLYDVMKWRSGKDWKKFAGSPPMDYPTYSASMIVSATGAHMTHVSCFGWVDRHEEGLFREDVNVWNDVFSNETALFRMSDASMARINEFRRIGQARRRVDGSAGFGRSAGENGSRHGSGCHIQSRWQNLIRQPEFRFTCSIGRSWG